MKKLRILLFLAITLLLVVGCGKKGNDLDGGEESIYDKSLEELREQLLSDEKGREDTSDIENNENTGNEENDSLEDGVEEEIKSKISVQAKFIERLSPSRVAMEVGGVEYNFYIDRRGLDLVEEEFKAGTSFFKVEYREDEKGKKEILDVLGLGENFLEGDLIEPLEDEENSFDKEVSDKE